MLEEERTRTMAEPVCPFDVRTLKEKEYEQKGRYRLVPYLW
jgi:hypothetical protein